MPEEKGQDKLTILLNLAAWGALLVQQELAERRERTGKTDVEILADAGHTVDETEVMALANIAKYRAAQGLPPIES